MCQRDTDQEETKTNKLVIGFQHPVNCTGKKQKKTQKQTKKLNSISSHE